MVWQLDPDPKTSPTNPGPPRGTVSFVIGRGRHQADLLRYTDDKTSSSSSAGNIEMSVDCVNQLGFHRPLSEYSTGDLEQSLTRLTASLVKESLVVRNPNNRPVVFKIKTTAPKQYCVRPNSGRIEPGQEVEVQVLLQAMKEEPPTDFRCRDKFLVQSTIISAEHESSSISVLWSAVESKNRDDIHEKKIRCVFLPADGAGYTHSTAHDTHREVRNRSDFVTLVLIRHSLHLRLYITVQRRALLTHVNLIRQRRTIALLTGPSFSR